MHKVRPCFFKVPSRFFGVCGLIISGRSSPLHTGPLAAAVCLVKFFCAQGGLWRVSLRGDGAGKREKYAFLVEFLRKVNAKAAEAKKNG